MLNTFVLQSKSDFNPFTLVLKARCEAQGEVLVKLRNGDYCKVVFRPENPKEYEDAAFHKPDHSAYWRVSGCSVTSSDFDIVELEEAAPTDLMSLRLQMHAEGWASEDRLTKQGWGGEAPGYSIWFQRGDWHGKRAMALVGTFATYHGHTKDPGKAFEAAMRAATLARKAWREHPDCPPGQGLEGLEPRKPLGSTNSMF